VVAIVGRPNVGKSTLFNRIVGGHNAIVEDQPGVTRDRRYGDADWAGKAFRVVDTGGIDIEAAKASSNTIAQAIVRQAMRAVEEADVVLLVLDAKEGMTPADHQAAEVLRRSGKPVLWVGNKVDGARHEAAAAAELYALGADEVHFVSATHGRGVGDLLDATLVRLTQAVDEVPDLPEPEAERPIRIALVGRPNAGKSSLINRLVGDERVIVDPTPGTTRDPVDTPFTYDDERYVLIDTAGIRKRARVELAMEKIAVAMAEKAMGRADVAILVIDAEAGVSEQEAKIAGLCDAAGCGLVIAFNKRDLVDAETERKLRRDIDRQLQFVPWAKVAYCSAKTGKGVRALLQTAREVYESAGHRVTTGALNRFFEGLVERHPPSVYRGHPIKLYYITQTGTHPPTFVLSVNYPEGVHFSYRRYLANQLRTEFGFEGTPVRIICRRRGGNKS
jgi:GTP-binding protein